MEDSQQVAAGNAASNGDSPAKVRTRTPALWSLCRRLVQVVGALLIVALIVAGVSMYQTPPPARLPPPADASACSSEAPKPKPGPVHIRKVADFDLVLFGASGFTGKLATRYLATAPGNFKFAIAGRSWSKLDKLDAKITKMVQQAGHGREVAAILLSDSQDVDGLRKIVRKARVVISAAGPYTLYGTRLVQVCAEEGTHYADISGEFYWQRRIIDSYSTTAQHSGAKVVLAAGYDSLPFDLGAALALQALDAAGGTAARSPTVTAVVTGMRGGLSGGTLASAGEQQKQEAAGKVPAEWAQDPYLLTPKTQCRVDADVDGWGKPRYDRDLGVAGMPHIMAPVNARIVRRSFELLGRRGVSYREGMSLGGLANAAFFILRWLRKMQLNPKPGKGPPTGVQTSGGFEAFVVARDEVSGRRVRVDLRGRGDPGYMHTSRLLAEMGLCLLNTTCHRAGMGGGVHTPVSAADANILAARLRTALHQDAAPLLEVDAVSNNGRRGEL